MASSCRGEITTLMQETHHLKVDIGPALKKLGLNLAESLFRDALLQELQIELQALINSELVAACLYRITKRHATKPRKKAKAAGIAPSHPTKPNTQPEEEDEK